jgi:predicted protein tyrosine phosphatase
MASLPRYYFRGKGSMEQVTPELFIGDLGDDRHVAGREGWAIIHAEKEIHRRYGQIHRLPLRDIFLTPDGTELFLSFEDALRMGEVNTRCILPAIEFTHRHVARGHRVLIHCVAGASRAPAIAMLYLLKYTDVLPRTNIFDAIFSFSEIYPLYDPNDGLLPYAAGFLEEIKGTVRTR